MTDSVFEKILLSMKMVGKKSKRFLKNPDFTKKSKTFSKKPDFDVKF
jgi:hypothetical protein